MKSKIIVIEGLDGSGKATQTKILCEKISALGKKVTKLEFPSSLLQERRQVHINEADCRNRAAFFRKDVS